MASPQESITTVNGRRCTRSRARFAVSSSLTTSEAAVVVTTQIATSTTVQAPPQIQTSAAAEVNPAPAPPPQSSAAPPSSAAPVEAPAAAPTPPPAASSAIGTTSEVSLPPTPPTLLANIAPASSAAPVLPAPVPVETTSSVAVASQVVALSTSNLPAAAPSSSSDTSIIAITSALNAQSSGPVPSFTAPAESALLLSSIAAIPEQSRAPDIIASPPADASNLPPPAETPSPTSEPAAGVIAPSRGTPGAPEEAGLTIPANGNANVGSIVGGVVGGVGGLAVICIILFLCLRKRDRSEPKWFEKSEDRPGILDKIKAVPEKIGMLFAKLKGKKKGPSGNAYHRHSQDSVSSIYSTPSHARGGSLNEPQGLYAVGVPANRSSSRASRTSKKGDRTVLRKKNSSTSSQSTFAGIMAELERDPFADPEPPKTLLLLNPDPNSPKGPMTPQPAATTAGAARNPFASPLDDDEVAGDILAGRSFFLGHKRNQSSVSALSSNPPEQFAAPDKPINNALNGPPPPGQAVLPNQKRRSSMAYPQFNALSTTDSRESYYGEPGPSRPGTNLFTPFTPMMTPGPATGRTVRQSDPFDLDRPEVLGFGNVVGRREVRGSVTRQGTLGRRTSSAGNWYNASSDQPYERDSAVPRPLWSAGGRR